MSKYKIFVSSNQKEFEKEREEIENFIKNNDLYNEIFEAYIFEISTPADGIPPNKIYPDKIRESDIFIGLIGQEYGEIDENGQSASENEFDIFYEGMNSRNAYMFILKDIIPDENTEKYIKKAKKVTYKRFNRAELIDEIAKSLKNFLRNKGILDKTEFDERFIPNIDISEFDLDEINCFIEKNKNEDKISEEEIENFLINKAKVLKKDNNSLNVNNAGVLFFISNPEKYLPQHEVKIAKFKGNNKAIILDNRIINKPMISMLYEIESFIKRNMMFSQKIEGFSRVDVLEYPLEALREAVVNALAHRDYDIKSSSISIYMYDNRLEITSPGKINPPLSIDSIRGHYSHRNKKVCDLFSKSKDMEAFGTGIDKMNKVMEESGMKHPEIIATDDFFKIIFYNNKNKNFNLRKPKNTITSNLKKEGFNDRQISALELMVNKGKIISISEYMDIFNVSRNTASKDLNQLVKEGLIYSYTHKNNKSMKGFGIVDVG